MAVFGEAITEGNRMERALKALRDQNLGGKHDDAISYVREKKGKWGTGVSTLCVFYNATGETLLYHKDDSRHGYIYDSYPTRVENGQWGAFLHVKTSGAATGTSAFVVYRTMLDDANFCNPLLCWETPWNQNCDNHAYCNIFAEGAVDSVDEVYRKMEQTGRQHAEYKKDMRITSSIESGTSPLYEAQITREHQK